MTTTIVSDSFNRSNSSTLGTADTGQTWQAINGSIAISNNTATNSANSSNNVAVINSGVSDCDISVTLEPSGNGNNEGIAFRVTDANNYFWYFANGNSNIYLYVLNAGSSSQLYHGSGIPYANGDTLEVDLSGATINLYHNGTLLTTVTNSFNQTATQHGLYFNYSGTYLDNFLLTTSGGGGTAHSVSLSDFITTSDSVSLVRTLHVAFSDSVVSSDAITKAVNRALAFSDSVTSSDALTTQSAHSYAVSLSDTVTLSDSLTKAQAHTYSLSFSDGVMTSDADTKATSRSLHDAITATDAMAQVRNYFRNYADSVTTSDSVTKQIVHALAFSDSVTVTDSVTASKVNVFSIHLSDSVSVTDAIAGLNRILSVALSDSVVFLDSVTMSGGKILNPIVGKISLLASLDNKVTLLASLDNQISLLAGVAPMAATNQNFALEQYSSDVLTFTYSGDLSECTLEWIMQYNVNSATPIIKKTSADGISIVSTSPTQSVFTVSITNADMNPTGGTPIGQGNYFHQASVVDALGESNPISKGTVMVSAASNN